MPHRGIGLRPFAAVGLWYRWWSEVGKYGGSWNWDGIGGVERWVWHWDKEVQANISRKRVWIANGELGVDFSVTGAGFLPIYEREGL
jgi:hypothetical protein